MRIALCANVLWEPRPCGTKTFLVEVFTRVCKNASSPFRLTVVAPPGEPARHAAELFQGLAEVREVAMRKWPARLLWLGGAFNISDQIGPHDVYLSGWHWPLGRRDAPFVAILHDVAPLASPRSHTPRSALLRLLFRLSLATMARRASRIVAVSGSTLADVARVMGRPVSEATVIPHGVDLTAWSSPRTPAQIADAVERCGLPRGARYLLGVGSHVPNKNQSVLVEAFARTAAADPDLHLVLAGAFGSETRRIRALAGAGGVGARVHLPGALGAPTLVALMQGATLFAFPSLHEGFGIPVLEAFAARTPVLCSDRGALAEIAGEAALLVDPSSPEAVAQAMARLTHDASLRDALVSRGWARARDFTWEAAADRYAEVLGEAASLPRGGSHGAA